MDIMAIRRKRMRQLIDERYGGKIVTFAKAIEREPNYISRVLRSKKGIGEEFCGYVEATLDLGKGWMSTEGEDSPGTGAEHLDSAFLYRCFKAVAAWIARGPHEISDENRVELACFLYEMFRDDKEVGDNTMIKWLDRWVSHARKSEPKQ
jgi:hypothetical protein